MRIILWLVAAALLYLGGSIASIPRHRHRAIDEAERFGRLEVLARAAVDESRGHLARAFVEDVAALEFEISWLEERLRKRGELTRLRLTLSLWADQRTPGLPLRRMSIDNLVLAALGLPTGLFSQAFLHSQQLHSQQSIEQTRAFLPHVRGATRRVRAWQRRFGLQRPSPGTH